MALSKQGFQDILILERSLSANEFQPTRGFVYSISGPGREALQEIGVHNIADIGADSLFHQSPCQRVYTLASFWKFDVKHENSIVLRSLRVLLELFVRMQPI
jgi:2-polyprenyl-6-methoxyphenol hydroxylase-like FAD-dependent oxidoreductase